MYKKQKFVAKDVMFYIDIKKLKKHGYGRIRITSKKGKQKSFPITDKNITEKGAMKLRDSLMRYEKCRFPVNYDPKTMKLKEVKKKPQKTKKVGRPRRKRGTVVPINFRELNDVQIQAHILSYAGLITKAAQEQLRRGVNKVTDDIFKNKKSNSEHEQLNFNGIKKTKGSKASIYPIKPSKTKNKWWVVALLGEGVGKGSKKWCKSLNEAKKFAESKGLSYTVKGGK